MGLLSKASTNTSPQTEPDILASETDDELLDDDVSIEVIPLEAELVEEEDTAIEIQELVEEEDSFIEIQELVEEEAPLELNEIDSSLDEMGKALSERIKRLPDNATTAYTALSLLKAYAAFQSGLCLTLENGVYSSYISINFGDDKISIPQNKIWSKEKSGSPYFKYDSGEELKVNSGTDNLNFWIFPIGQNSLTPWEDIMILGVSERTESGSAFNPQSISALIPDISDKLVLKMSEESPEPVDQNWLELEQGSLEESSLEEVSLEQVSLEEVSLEESSLEQGSPELHSEKPGSLKDKITDYGRIHNDFGCILLDFPDSAGEEEKNGFCKTLSEVLNLTGTVLPLPTGRPLILLPGLYDRELIAHRLSLSLKARLIDCFEADSPDTVFEKINPPL